MKPRGNQDLHGLSREGSRRDDDIPRARGLARGDLQRHPALGCTTTSRKYADSRAATRDDSVLVSRECRRRAATSAPIVEGSSEKRLVCVPIAEVTWRRFAAADVS
jgi:hypothetical protein